MAFTRRRFNLRIWCLALGYFGFYAPYAALLKATTSGLLPGTNETLKGFELLPATVIGTSFVLLAAASLFGWWKYAGRRRVFGVNVIWPSRLVFLSGFGTAIIICTTTLAYTFTGVSIVFAILLLRGGVLILAPAVDLLFRRRVRWFSWTALALSLAAVFITLADVNNYQMTVVVALDITAYMIGYLIRLPCLNKLGKSEDRSVTYRYLVEEMAVAAIFLVTIPSLFALIGRGDIMLDLRHGFTNFFDGSATAPGLLIGALYACLYFFGTLIYLDSRENTFCIPLNRASSLLAGVFASYALADLSGQKPPSVAQLGGAALIIAALLFLSPLHHGHRVARRVRHAFGVAYRAFVEDFAGRSPAALAQTASPENIHGMSERLTDEDRFTAE